MNNVIQMQGYEFSTYHLGLRHIFRSLETTRVADDEKRLFVGKQVGNFFRLARMRSGLTETAAATYFGLSPQVISEFESGRSSISARFIYRFCTRYGVSKDFEVMDALLREALAPERRGAFARIRPELEKRGLVPPQQ